MNKEKKIYFDNFPRESQVLHAVAQNDKNKNIRFQTFGNDTINKEVTNSAIRSNFLTNIFTHDKIVLNILDYMSILSAFGSKDVIKLMNTGLIELADDNQTEIIALNEDNNFSITSCQVTRGRKRDSSAIEYLEELINKNRKASRDVRNLLLLHAEKNLISIDTNTLLKHIENDTKYDLKNQNITNFLSIKSTNINAIYPEETYKCLRLANANKSLIYGNKLGCNSILADGAIESIWKAKASPSFQNKDVDNITLKDMLNYKGIPDFSELYVNNIVTLDEILKIRDNFHSTLFKEWYHRERRDKDKVIKELLNQSTIGAKQKLLRSTATTVVGLLGPIQSIAANYADSYIAEKIFSGWHPNLFLDQNLRTFIDKKITNHEQQLKAEKIRKRFPGTRRNDKCPCGSGIKFKKCCGR